MQRLSREYLTHRNRQMEAKAFLAETEAQRRRGELLDKRRIAAQIGDVFVALRQAILNFAPRYASRMVGLRDEHAAKQILTTAAHEFLTAVIRTLGLKRSFSMKRTRARSLFDRQAPSKSRLRKRRRRFVARKKLRRCDACGRSNKPGLVSARAWREVESSDFCMQKNGLSERGLG